MMYETPVKLAGVCFRCRHRFFETVASMPRAPRVGQCYADKDPAERRNPEVDWPIVTIPDEEWADCDKLHLPPTAHTEFTLLTAYFSDALLPFDRVIIHAVALRWRNRAYLICANPGVGKSTQARFLQELRPGEFGVICGDRPILQCCLSERNEVEPKNPSPFSPSNQENVAAHTGAPQPLVLVHPSPWNGKENWHGAEPAPLGGIILLERGENNRIFSLREREAIIPVFTSLIQTLSDEEKVRSAASLGTSLLRAAPLWKLCTHDVPASTQLLLDAVFCG